MEEPPPPQDSTIRMLEEFGLNAWPAPQQMALDGWLLRFANGFSRRANSVHSIYGESSPGASADGARAGDVEAKIQLCEGVYAARGLSPVFRMTPISRPPQLDEILAARGYRREGETAVLARTLPPVDGEGLQPAGFDDAAPGARIMLCESLERDGEEWLAGVTAIRARPPATIATFRNILSGVITRACYVLLKAGDRPAACAMGVLQQDWVGIQEVARAEEFRGSGYGRQALDLVQDWAAAYGTGRAWVACEATNRPALQMYHDAGYTEVYRYWYRVRPRPGERH